MVCNLLKDTAMYILTCVVELNTAIQMSSRKIGEKTFAFLST